MFILVFDWVNNKYIRLDKLYKNLFGIRVIGWIFKDDLMIIRRLVYNRIE